MKSVVTFGCFVEIAPGREVSRNYLFSGCTFGYKRVTELPRTVDFLQALLHISELDNRRVTKVEDVSLVHALS